MDQQAFYLIYLGFMKHIYLKNYPVVLKIFFQTISLAFDKVLVLSNA